MLDNLAVSLLLIKKVSQLAEVGILRIPGNSFIYVFMGLETRRVHLKLFPQTTGNLQETVQNVSIYSRIEVKSNS